MCQLQDLQVAEILVIECKVSVQEEAKVACRWNGFCDCRWVYFQCGVVYKLIKLLPLENIFNQTKLWICRSSSTLLSTCIT